MGIKTDGQGDAEAEESLAIGAVFAMASVNDAVLANNAGSLTTSTGNVNLKSRSRNKSQTNTKAAASGAADKGKNVDQQADAQKTAAKDQKNTGSGKENPSSKTSGGPIAVAAAISYHVRDADVASRVSTGGAISAPNGTVTLSSLVNYDESTDADGQAVKAGSFGVGAAAAGSAGVNVVQGHTYASIGADAQVTAGDNVEVRASDDTGLVDFIGALSGSKQGKALGIGVVRRRLCARHQCRHHAGRRQRRRRQ